MREYAIILAADLPTPEDVFTVVREVGTIVDGIKVGAATLLQKGARAIAEIREIVGDRPILIDLKIADIGFYSSGGWDGTNAKILHALQGQGASHVTVHGFPGPVSVAEAVASARDAGIGVLLLPLMSHAGASLFFGSRVEIATLAEQVFEAGLQLAFPADRPCRDVTEAILLMGEALHVEGYVGPATRPDDLRRYRTMTDKPIWCPGFGRQDRFGRSLEEQFKEWAAIVGPQSAAIVGSAIFKADDPAGAASAIMDMRDRAVKAIES
ncbi:MAG: orotidine 5'-phosphate decarboxylase [Deltaproteobacteria bacterium]|nr:orotidine 5'-phosphate decarboxylase [Deltaproteobacteria bacterium]